jgi:radical SAM superfamily enzyme YgiQ (UPF0313 family)
VIPKVRLLNRKARLIAYGLYAPANAEYLRELGVDTIIGGEFEAALLQALQKPLTVVSLDRLQFLHPDRSSLPALARYGKLRSNGDTRIAGYTEASRGCKHKCRHCPVVPVYEGAFRIVKPEIVLADISQQVKAGARHITFGDPDFWNGPTHAMRIVREMHAAFPTVTYDVTIKVEHLLKHSEYLRELRNTGCLFVTTAVESFNDEILGYLDKGHTRADFLEAVKLCRDAELTLAPTFVAFTPWTSREGYRELLSEIRELGLIENVGSIQLALRLLLPQGSLLLKEPSLQPHLKSWDKKALLHRWVHPDPQMDVLSSRMLHLVAGAQKLGKSRTEIFESAWQLAFDEPMPALPPMLARAAIPYMEEPWYC